MATLLFHVDAFTRAAFKGNPAAVVLLDDFREDAWLQAMAAEMNLSETAFALKMKEGTFALRWFTPKVEVPLCGHATLATAAVLFSQGVVTERVTFETASGSLRVERAGKAYAMRFPSHPPVRVEAEAKGLVVALGVTAVETWHAPKLRTLLVRVGSQADVAAAKPDVRALVAAENPLDIGGVIVTAPGDARGPTSPHFVSRYFAPWVGIDEDPVTGSAHCVLGPYWAEKLGRKKMLAVQCSARGGELGVEVNAAEVVLTGSCVVVSRGVLMDAV